MLSLWVKWKNDAKDSHTRKHDCHSYKDHIIVERIKAWQNIVFYLCHTIIHNIFRDTPPTEWYEDSLLCVGSLLKQTYNKIKWKLFQTLHFQKRQSPTFSNPLNRRWQGGFQCAKKMSTRPNLHNNSFYRNRAWPHGKHFERKFVLLMNDSELKINLQCVWVSQYFGRFFFLSFFAEWVTTPKLHTSLKLLESQNQRI